MRRGAQRPEKSESKGQNRKNKFRKDFFRKIFYPQKFLPLNTCAHDDGMVLYFPRTMVNKSLIFQIQLRVFAFCVNILHAYITGPIIYQNDDAPLLAPGMLNKIRALALVLPLALFIIITFAFPILSMLLRSVDDKQINTEYSKSIFLTTYN